MDVQIVPIAIIIGLFLPIPFWIGHKFFPKAQLDGVVTPVFCWTLGYLRYGAPRSYVLCGRS